MSDLLLTPLPQPIQKTIKIPGSLSFTTRSLILAALKPSPVEILNPLFSDDVFSMLDCLKQIGIDFQIFRQSKGDAQDKILVQNNITTTNLKSSDQIICNAGLSGRTARSILPVLCLIPGIKTLTAKPAFLKRPIGDLVDGLRQLGAEIEYLDSNAEQTGETSNKGKLPLKITSENLKKNAKIQLKGNVSSQFLSGILMIAPLIGGIEIEVTGKQVSKSYVDITLDIMKSFGFEVENQDYKIYKVKPELSASKNQKLFSYNVEGDYSGATYFAGLAAVTGSTITLTNLNPNSVQGDKMVFEILAKMGAEVKFLQKENTIQITGKNLIPGKFYMENAIDQPPLVGVVAAFCEGKTELTGLEILKYKESNRLEAVQNELVKLGVKTESDGVNLIIYGKGKNPANFKTPAEIQTYHDHRIAMSFAVAGSVLNGITIKNSKVVSKSFPNFWEFWTYCSSI